MSAADPPELEEPELEEHDPMMTIFNPSRQVGAELEDPPRLVWRD